MRKVNIFHEWLDTAGGAELVLEELLKLFPEATIYTLWADQSFKESLGVNIEVSFLQRLSPRIRRTVGLPLMPLAWKILSRKIGDHDLSITSSWVFGHSAIPKRFESKSFHYIHTPARYWWNPEVDNRTRMKIPTFVLHIFRKLDKYLARNHLNVLANSYSTKDRIFNYWSLESVVVHPPVDVDFFDYARVVNLKKQANFLLCVGRFVPYKGHDIAIRLGEALNLPVVLVGHGSGEEKLRKLAAKSTIEVMFEINASRERIRELYSQCYCLVYPAIEDFGIVPVEAMAVGALVLGVKKGGLSDSVIQDETGSLAPSLNLKDLLESFHNLPAHNRSIARSQSLKFSKENFHSKIIEYVEFRQLLC